MILGIDYGKASTVADTATWIDFDQLPRRAQLLMRTWLATLAGALLAWRWALARLTRNPDIGGVLLFLGIALFAVPLVATTISAHAQLHVAAARSGRSVWALWLRHLIGTALAVWLIYWAVALVQALLRLAGS